MRVQFSPCSGFHDLPWSVDGDVLTVDGTAYDFAPLAEGDALPAEATGCPHLVGQIERREGDIVLTLRLPHGPSAIRERRFPEPVVIASGTPDLPPFN